MKENLQKNLNEFLRESNYIENERSQEAEEDAYKAWRFLENFGELTLTRILETHSILMKRLNPRIAGRIRNREVMVGGKLCPIYLLIDDLLDVWLKDYRDARTEEEIKRAHVAFEGIHPFEDGNGRTGRILYNWQRVKNGFPVEVFWEKDKLDYYQWFKVNKKNAPKKERKNSKGSFAQEKEGSEIL